MHHKVPNLETCISDILYFFDFYGMNDIEELLWDLLSYALTCEDVDNWDSYRRNNTLHFFRLLTKVITALYVLLAPIIDKDETH